MNRGILVTCGNQYQNSTLQRKMFTLKNTVVPEKNSEMLFFDSGTASTHYMKFLNQICKKKLVFTPHQWTKIILAHWEGTHTREKHQKNNYTIKQGRGGTKKETVCFVDLS